MPRTPLQALAFVLGFWLALALSPFGARAGDALPPLAELEAAFHRDVNAVRTHAHLVPLERREDLDRVARDHSHDMARRAYLSHDTPEGLSPVDRLRRSGLAGFTLAAENAGRTNTADPNGQILAGWLASPDHHRNLHAPPFNATGIGIARAADGGLYYTQLYVSYPRAARAESRPTATAP